MAAKCCSIPPFQIDACDNNRSLIGQTGLSFFAQAFNVKNAPVSWSIDGFDGDIQNVTIDSVTGEITYDAPDSITNNGLGQITVTATDVKDNRVSAIICTKSADPVNRIILACNADLANNLPTLQSKLVFDGRVTETSVFTDLAKTTQANDGDTVEVWEDGTGNGDVTLRIDDEGPTFMQGGAPNGHNSLNFSGSNQSLQYDVPGAPAPGSPFKLFFLVRIDPSANDSNATVVSSTFQASNNSTANNSWQVSRDGSTQDFVFRIASSGSTIISGSNTNGQTSGVSNDSDFILAPWSIAKNGNWHLVYINYDGSIVQGYFDGALSFEIDTTPSGQQLAAEHFKFGENRAGGNYLAMDLAELTFANAAVDDTEATQIQAYYLCKFGLDASLLSDPGPFAVNEKAFFSQVSQFELQVYSDGRSLVYDLMNAVYYDKSDVPAPDLGLFRDPATACLIEQIANV
jgi:hypothetical protein